MNNFVNELSEENNYLVCEACGNKMDELGCKIKCNKCGYFRSCSDPF